MPDITIELVGMDKLLEDLGKLDGHLGRTMESAGAEAAEMILDEEGIRSYPPMMDNKPAMPMTDRQRKAYFAKLHAGEIEVPYRRGQSPGSEKAGSQWKVEARQYQTTVGNRASYAQYLWGSKDQSSYMAGLGWKKLFETAKGMQSKITRIYQGWVNKLISDLGLK